MPAWPISPRAILHFDICILHFDLRVLRAMYYKRTGSSFSRRCFPPSLLSWAAKFPATTDRGYPPRAILHFDICILHFDLRVLRAMRSVVQ